MSSKTEAYVLARLSGLSDQDAREKADLPHPPGRAFKLYELANRILTSRTDVDWVESQYRKKKAELAQLRRLKRAKNLCDTLKRRKGSVVIQAAE